MTVSTFSVGFLASSAVLLTLLSGCTNGVETPEEEVSQGSEAVGTDTAALGLGSDTKDIVAARLAFEAAYALTQSPFCKVVDPTTRPLEPALRANRDWRCCAVDAGDTKLLCAGATNGVPAGEEFAQWDCGSQTIYSSGNLRRFVRYYNAGSKMLKRQQVNSGWERWSLNANGAGTPYINYYANYLLTYTPDAPGNNPLTENWKGEEARATTSSGAPLWHDYGQITFPSDGSEPIVKSGEWPAIFNWYEGVYKPVCAAVGATDY